MAAQASKLDGCHRILRDLSLSYECVFGVKKCVSAWMQSTDLS